MVISKFLLEILVCPKCKTNLVLDQDRIALLCENCRLKYRIENDIPIMLIDEAEPY